MANFIGLVYATLKNEGVDTSGMSTDEAVAKFKELQKSSGGNEGEKEATPAENRKLEEKGIKETVTEDVDVYDLSESDTSVIDDAIYWLKQNNQDVTPENVIKQINEDMSGFMPSENSSKYNAIVDYINKYSENSEQKQIIDEGKKQWANTPENEQVWNSLTDDDKYLLSMSNDMGFWYDEVLDNEDVLKRYEILKSKFNFDKK